MTGFALFLILLALFSFVAGQIFLKHAMESTSRTDFRKPMIASQLATGIVLMTVSFFLTLGLLQRFDLSYLYPFQGLSIVMITVTAAVVLQERLTVRLIIGASLITAGVVLVSMS
jgi:drug/metabolite transporter (DMT)-like permease